MIGSKEYPYAGRLERWHEVYYAGKWSLAGYLFDPQLGHFPGAPHRTGNILILNEITREVKTEEGTYRLGQKKPTISTSIYSDYDLID